MKNKTLLYINRLLAFIAFLAIFGKILYDFGAAQVFEKGFKPYVDYTMAYVFIVFYLALLILSHCYVGAMFYSKKPYICGLYNPYVGDSRYNVFIGRYNDFRGHCGRYRFYVRYYTAFACDRSYILFVGTYVREKPNINLLKNPDL
mgnify:CR=1 FL=1